MRDKSIHPGYGRGNCFFLSHSFKVTATHCVEQGNSASKENIHDPRCSPWAPWLVSSAGYVTERRSSCLPPRKPINTRKAGAEVKERGSLRCRPPGKDSGRVSQSPPPPLSAGRGVDKEGEGNRTKIRGGGRKVLHVQTSQVHSCNASHCPVCNILTWSSWLGHPGSTAEGQLTSQAWDA